MYGTADRSPAVAGVADALGEAVREVERDGAGLDGLRLGVALALLLGPEEVGAGLDGVALGPLGRWLAEPDGVGLAEALGARLLLAAALGEGVGCGSGLHPASTTAATTAPLTSRGLRA